MFLSYIKKSSVTYKIRNSLKIKPAAIIMPGDNKSYSISDAFCWRKDTSFVTNFRYTDLVNYFLGNNNVTIKLVLKDHNNNTLDVIKLNQDTISDDICINDQVKKIKNLSGHFFIFHELKPKQNETLVVRNSCYTSYSLEGKTPSIVHGNLPVLAEDSSSKIYPKSIIQYSHFRKYTYRIQNNFSSYDKVEAFIFNPTDIKLKIQINDILFDLKPYTSKIIQLPKANIYTIKSKCLFLRPILFVYKDNCFDVMHA